jgi:Mn2+/Fe2+ NRAMP family transporter
MVTGRGLAAFVRIYYPRWVLWGACSILVVANVINIGADLGGGGPEADPTRRILTQPSVEKSF